MTKTKMFWNIDYRMADYLKATGREDIAKEAEKYQEVRILRKLYRKLILNLTVHKKSSEFINFYYRNGLYLVYKMSWFTTNIKQVDY
jgi:hypothetical protein